MDIPDTPPPPRRFKHTEPFLIMRTQLEQIQALDAPMVSLVELKAAYSILDIFRDLSSELMEGDNPPIATVTALYCAMTAMAEEIEKRVEAGRKLLGRDPFPDMGWRES